MRVPIKVVACAICAIVLAGCREKNEQESAGDVARPPAGAATAMPVTQAAWAPDALDELVAMGQFLVQSHRRGEPFWRTFFQGGADPNGGHDHRPGFDAHIGQAATSAARGVTVPWTLLVATLLGVWLMFTRLVFGTAPPLADRDHLIGALVITVAVIAMAEVARPLRFINVAVALWLIAAAWLRKEPAKRAEIDKTLSNLNDVAMQARIVPAFKDGVAQGFKLFSIRPDSIYTKIGVQNGDVLKRINGYDLNSPEKALEIYSKLKEASRIDIEIERNGAAVRKTYNVR